MTDTGGLGLLQLLLQAGLPPNVLHQVILHMSQQPQPTSPQSNGGESGISAPAAPEGATTGVGNMSGGQAISAALSGLSGGLIGQAAQDATGVNASLAGLGGRAALTGANLMGGHLGPFGFANTLMGMLYGLARGAEASTGKVDPETFSEAAARFADPKNWFTDFRDPTEPTPPPPIPYYGLPTDLPQPKDLETPDARGFPNDPTLGVTPEGLPEGLASAIGAAVAAAGSSGNTGDDGDAGDAGDSG